MHINYIKKLTKIQGVLVKKVTETTNSLILSIDTKPKINICPACNHETSKIHDYRLQTIQHGNFNSTTIFLELNKRRYVCKNCGKRFDEKYDFVQRFFRKSNLLFHKIIKDSKMQKSLKTIADDNNVSSTTVNRYIGFEIALTNKADIYMFPEVIGIDEFKGNAGLYKYQLQITDLKTKKVIDIIKSRTYDELEVYFSKIKNRDKVKFVTMDLYAPFKKIIKDKFLNAEIIADKFHYTRLITEVLDKARIDFQRDLSKDYRGYFKGIKKLLIMREHLLNTDGKTRLLKAFEISSELKKIYDVKEKFYYINDAIGSDEKESVFREWLFETESSSVYSYFKSCISTLRTWHKYITNSFKYNMSNAIVEGINNKIKVIKRVSYGFRNFDNFRNRILIICS